MNKPYIICPRKNGYTEAMRIFNLMKSILDSGKEKSNEILWM